MTDRQETDTDRETVTDRKYTHARAHADAHEHGEKRSKFNPATMTEDECYESEERLNLLVAAWALQK